MNRITKLLAPALILFGALVGGSPAWGVSPYDDVLVQKAVQDLAKENYDEALAELTEAWQKGVHSPDKAFLLGQTYRLMLNYPKAKEYLQEALRLKPNLPQAQLMLADTLLALDRPKEARPLLEAIEPTGYEPGQVAFLRGMTESKEGKHSVALDYFQKAQQDPKMAQEAKFQASLALAALNRLKEAKDSMEQAIAINPQSQTADFAQRYKSILEKRCQETKPFRATVTTGYDYDSNVTLQPGGAGAAAQSAGQGDQVFYQTATFEYNLNANQPFSFLTQYSYFQNFHPRISSYDQMSHFVGAIPTYSYKSGRVWVPCNYNYVDVQTDKYYTGFAANPTWLHLLNENVGLELSGKFNRKYYWWPLSLPQDDRNAKSLGGSLGAYYFFKKQTGFIQARFTCEHDYTVGTNWDNTSYRLLLAALYPVTEKLKVNAFVDLNLQPFDNYFINGSTVDNVAGNPLILFPKRNDKTIITGLQITYNVWNGLDFNVHYFYSRDDSNTSLYRYTRHIVGGQIAYRY
ncbi:MAG: tetratricopeptide repeat protein [Deltaproteobacteria bacterium]|nr:tetratricopeptide repeat protein [Deltaproteobacteria bacterium]